MTDEELANAVRTGARDLNNASNAAVQRGLRVELDTIRAREISAKHDILMITPIIERVTNL